MARAPSTPVRDDCAAPGVADFVPEQGIGLAAKELLAIQGPIAVGIGHRGIGTVEAEFIRIGHIVAIAIDDGGLDAQPFLERRVDSGLGEEPSAQRIKVSTAVPSRGSTITSSSLFNSGEVAGANKLRSASAACATVLVASGCS